MIMKSGVNISKNFIKRLLISILVSILIGLAVGSFFPNPYIKYKLRVKAETFYTNWANELGLNEPAFEYANDKQFVKAVEKCIDWVNFETLKYQRVPGEMIVAQAVLESGWGTSRFALEGNNLFGIRTYDKNIPHMLIEGTKKWPGWGVRVFTTKCQSVQYFVNLLNSHPAYAEFRDKRTTMLVLGQQLDSKVLIKTLKLYSTTKDYAERVNFIVDKIRDREEKVGEIPIEVKSDSKTNTIIPESKPKDLTK